MMSGLYLRGWRFGVNYDFDSLEVLRMSLPSVLGVQGRRLVPISEKRSVENKLVFKERIGSEESQKTTRSLREIPPRGRRSPRNHGVTVGSHLNEIIRMKFFILKNKPNLRFYGNVFVSSR